MYRKEKKCHNLLLSDIFFHLLKIVNRKKIYLYLHPLKFIFFYGLYQFFYYHILFLFTILSKNNLYIILMVSFFVNNWIFLGLLFSLNFLQCAMFLVYADLIFISILPGWRPVGLFHPGVVQFIVSHVFYS